MAVNIVKKEEKHSEDSHNSDISSSIPNRWFVLNFIDRHIREIQWALYGVGALGAGLIIRDTYLFKQFKRVSEIPIKFIRNNLTLQGKVISVGAFERGSDNIPVLYTKHQSLLRTPTFIKKEDSELCYLPVGLAGICQSQQVLTWLNHNVQHQHIWFTMLERSEGRIDSIVSFRKGWRKIRINEELIKQGIGEVYHYEKLPDNKPYERFVLNLLKLETQAVQCGTGIWKEETPSYWTRVSKCYKSIHDRIFEKKKK